MGRLGRVGGAGGGGLHALCPLLACKNSCLRKLISFRYQINKQTEQEHYCLTVGVRDQSGRLQAALQLDALAAQQT